MAAHLTQCPFCREAVPQVHLSPRRGANGRQQIRRGLLFMLLAALIYYFAGGYGAPLRQTIRRALASASPTHRVAGVAPPSSPAAPGYWADFSPVIS